MKTTDIGSAGAGSAFFLLGILGAYRAPATGRSAWLRSFPDHEAQPGVAGPLAPVRPR